MRKMIIVTLMVFMGAVLMACENQLACGEGTVQQGNECLPDVVDSELFLSIYELAVNADQTDMTYEEWLESIRGEDGIPGEDGREVLLQIFDGVLQWKHLGDELWNDLYDLKVLEAEEITLQVSDGYLQWKYESEVDWVNLLDMNSLIGTNGQDGINGIDGRDIELRAFQGIVQWKYSGDMVWNDLFDYRSISPTVIIESEMQFTLNACAHFVSNDGEVIPGEYKGKDALSCHPVFEFDNQLINYYSSAGDDLGREYLPIVLVTELNESSAAFFEIAAIGAAFDMIEIYFYKQGDNREVVHYLTITIDSVHVTSMMIDKNPLYNTEMYPNGSVLVMELFPTNIHWFDEINETGYSDTVVEGTV